MVAVHSSPSVRRSTQCSIAAATEPIRLTVNDFRAESADPSLHAVVLHEVHRDGAPNDSAE
jgi:hypothetical protein